MGKMNIGIIGAGNISESHIAGYRNHPDAMIFAISDPNEQRAREKASLHQIPHTFKDYRDMLSQPEIDAVSICTWNDMHAEISIAALEAGKHVLVEKPLCQTVEQALQIEETVKRTGRTLQIGYVRRFNSKLLALKPFLETGELGEIYYAKASYLRRLGNPGGWFSDKARSGGGPLIDIGVHIIDACWYLMGRPRVQSVNGNVYHHLGNRANIQNLSFYKAADYDAEKNDVEDMANALIRFENGSSLLVDVSFTLHAKHDEEKIIRLYGTKGSVEIEPEFIIVTEKHDTILNLYPQITMRKAFQQQIDHFIRCCQSGETSISPVQDGVEMMKILCAIYESAEKGKEITLA